ncbi:MAG: SpoIIE family protein phosphatase, partial [Acidimicrobiia bacterium]|nr:SpoIIE family protein phosphatase [Acidimicrobiia bacterium]
MTADWLTVRALTTRLRRMSMRTQLLIAVNVVLVAGLAVILFVDYRHDVQQRVMERRSALEGEAIALLSSVRSLAHRDADLMQAYLDDVCAQMSEQSSPGHHIALQLGEQVLQAQAHHRASVAILESMAAGADGPRGESVANGRRMVVGHAGEPGMRVFVSEYVSDIVAAVQGQVARRSVALAGLGLVAALFVNLILVRTLGTSLRRLVQTVREIGQGGIGAQAPSFNSSEFSYLASEINAMSRSLAAANNEREQQLRKAQRIQAHLHPGHPQVEGLEIAVLYQPATEIAGDFYDVLRLADGAWLLALGDVCGHGVPAAMGAAILKTLLAAAVDSSSDIQRMLASINERFCSITLPEDFASLILVKWQPRGREIEYASAGHETCFRVRPDGIETALVSTGTLLGIDRDASWETAEIEVHPHDMLVLVTDGVTESMSSDGAVYGREAVARVAVDVVSHSPDAVASRLSSELAAHRAHTAAHDDVTAIVVR